MGGEGPSRKANDAEVTKVHELNVFGLLRVTRAVLPHFRERKSGHVVNLSSIGGLVGLPGFGIYNATKFAVEGLSEALAAEVAPLGIRVTIVEPGPFRWTISTNFPKREVVSRKAWTSSIKDWRARSKGLSHNANPSAWNSDESTGKRAYWWSCVSKSLGVPK